MLRYYRKFFLFITSLIMMSLMIQPIVLADQEVIVNVDVLNVRSGPGLDYQQIAKVYRGERFPIIEEKNEWIKIRVNNTEGWVANWLVEKADLSNKEPEQIAEANVSRLNVRSGPSQSFPVIDQINPGINYPVLDQEGDWIKIQLNIDKTGWIAGWMVTISEKTPSEKTVTTEKVTIEVDILNVRSGPSTEFPVIGQLTKGTQVEVIAVEQGWYQIHFSEKEGWITSQFASGSTPENKPQNTSENASGQPETQPSEVVNKKVVVQSETLNLREGPGLDQKIVGKLNKNEILIVIQSQGDWLYIQKEADLNIKGWVANWLVIDHSQYILNQPTVTILNPGTNLREGPGTSYPAIERADVGDQFPILDTEGDWYQIQLPDGKKAYVAGWIVSVKGINQNISHGIEKLLKGKVIVVDAGHGGKDNGATGAHFHTLEKTINLKVAVKLKKKLEASGAKVIMTRESDKYVSLQQRVDMTIINQADAFISIHHNTNSDYKINGTITYYFDKKDEKLAAEIHRELLKKIGLKDLKVRYGNYFVLRENPSVAILAELAFISNYQDELKARSDQFQENAAEGLFQGIIKYFK